VIGRALRPLARLAVWLYLNTMVHPLSTRGETAGGLRPSRRLTWIVAVAGIGLAVALLFGALVLWFHYGTTVFFEMIASGISACF